MGHGSIQVNGGHLWASHPNADVSHVDRLDVKAPDEEATSLRQNAPPAHLAVSDEMQIPSDVVDFIWWRRDDSNLRPTDYETVGLFYRGFRSKLLRPRAMLARNGAREALTR